MIHHVCNNSEPSQRTLSLIYLINQLNNANLPATLYGNNSWPKGRCNFKKIDEFKIKRGDILILDGIKMHSLFDAVNIPLSFYSFGRKNRIIVLIKSIIKYIKNLLTFNYRFKTILYNPHKNQKNYHFDMDISNNEKLNFTKIIPPPINIEHEGALYLFEDIEEVNDISEKIQEANQNSIILAGAITSPSYFKETIIPIIKSSKKTIQYIGFQEEMNALNINRNHIGANTENIVKNWIEILKGLE